MTATDVDRNGEVSASELQSMFAAAGLVFSLQTVMKLITLHSPRDRGTLDFAEFTNVQGSLRNIQASFQYFDSSRTGEARPSRRMLRALHHAGFGHVDEGAVKSACQAFDPDRHAGPSLDQYIARRLFLLAATAFDAAATLRRRRAPRHWTSTSSCTPRPRRGEERICSFVTSKSRNCSRNKTAYEVSRRKKKSRPSSVQRVPGRRFRYVRRVPSPHEVADVEQADRRADAMRRRAPAAAAGGIFCPSSRMCARTRNSPSSRARFLDLASTSSG